VVPASFTFSNAPVYLQVVYFDQGFGQLQVQYDSVANGAYASSPLHSHSSRVNSGAFAIAYFELPAAAFLKRQGTGADLRVGLGGSPPLSVQSATLQNFPFPDPQFQLALSAPWLRPYSGPDRNDVDTTTLRRKVMAGYQGWFRAPNDLSDQGWVHWVRNGTMAATNFNTDMWPDISGFAGSELFPATGIQTRSGQPAWLFSSATPATVARHFQWMRKYNLDGAFLQRFAAPGSGGYYGGDEWVLNNVRAAAHQEGRIWAIEYDVSSLNDGNALEVMTNDWRWLVDSVGVRQDSRYAYENGKPVVFIWGLPYPSKGFSLTTANAIVDFFHNDPVYGGNYVIGGWPWWWQTLTNWNDHFQRYDGALAWQPQNAAGYLADFQQLSAWGIDYFPHVWPGGSWANLQQLDNETQYSPRTGGFYYWQDVYAALGSGATRLFIGMFDEYDESTAVMPMTDDPPDPPPAWGRFLTNLGKPSDWWLLLTGAARDLLLGYRPYSPVTPAESSLTNRANTGPLAFVELGATNQTTLLYPVTAADGDPAATNYAGRDCRFNPSPATNRFFYFNLDDTFAYATNGLSATVEIDYYDSTNAGSFTLQYDGVSGAYETAEPPISLRGTGLWLTARFNLTDAYFGNRENGGADFRIAAVANVTLYVDQVRVSLPDNLPPPRKATVLVPPGATWRYLDTGIAPATNWMANDFNAATWKQGAAPLGYGVGDEATVVSFGGQGGNKHPTTWFRGTFVVGNPSEFYSLVLGARRDDGAVIYLNGSEIYRGNMAAGPVSATTLATNDTTGLDRQLLFEHNVDSSLLVAGTNVIAAEVHLFSVSSPDLGFDFTLTGLTENQVRPALIPLTNDALQWAANVGGYFTPSFSTNLTPPVSWFPLTNSPMLERGQWVLPTPGNSPPNTFFRLQAR